MARKQLGELLIELGAITDAQLHKALDDIRKIPGMRLGRHLTKTGVCSEEDVARALALQFNMTYLPLEEVEVDPEVARMVSEEHARRHSLLPLKAVGDRLIVAVTDPLDVFALDEIAFVSRQMVESVVVTESTLSHLISLVFQKEEEQAPTAVRDNRARLRLSERRADIHTDPGESEEMASGIQLGRLAPAEEPDSTRLPPARRRPAPVEGTGPQDEGRIVPLVDSILLEAVHQGASDIHIEPLEGDVRVRYRIDGVLHPVRQLSKDDQSGVASRIKVISGMDISERRIPQDGRFQLREAGREIDIRVSSLPTIFGEKLVLRLLDKSQAITRLNGLGFSESVRTTYERLIQRSYGMILATGPTGSGKTTTLMATLHEINKDDVNIITIEDPVEYQVPGVNQVALNSKAGLTFASGLRSILRQDPNVILVGEIRDEETAEIATRAALTGHLVLSTLHTNDAPGAVSRLIDMGVKPFLVASSVIGVVAQRLARKLCDNCRKPYVVDDDALVRKFLDLPKGPQRFYRAGGGCLRCSRTGYKGRMALFELLDVTKEIRNLIVTGGSEDEIRRTAIEQGMVPLLNDGVEKARRGLTSLEEILRVAFTES